MPKTVDLTTVPYEALLAELRRRKVSAPGAPRTCECGACPTCLKREQVARYREKKREAALAKKWPSYPMRANTKAAGA